MATFRNRSNGIQVSIRLKGKPPLYRTFPTQSEAEQWAIEQEASPTSLRNVLSTYRDKGYTKAGKRLSRTDVFLIDKVLGIFPDSLLSKNVKDVTEK